jgi:hypothetical protein
MRLYFHIKNLIWVVASLAWLVSVPMSIYAQRNDVDSLDKTVLDLFAKYPQDDNLKVIINSHARREPMEQLHVAFYSTWFLNGNPRVPMTTIVNTESEVSFYPLPNSEVGPTGSRWKRLADADMPTLIATLKALPETAVLVALSNLVIVSFRLDGHWQTRLYDRANPPTELMTIYRAAHSRLD